MTFNNSKNNSVGNDSRLNARDGLLYLLVGGGIGAAVALLFAPKAGADLRSDISDISRKGLDQTRDLARNLKEQSTDVYNSVKEKASDVYEQASAKIAKAQDTIDNAIDTATDRVNGEIREAVDIHSQKLTCTTRRPSNIV